jgi:hypothetical protein
MQPAWRAQRVLFVHAGVIDAPVGWSAELSPWCVTVTGCRSSGAKGDTVAASCLHDPPDRVHNDLWLVDRYHVTGLSSDHQTSSF